MLSACPPCLSVCPRDYGLTGRQLRFVQAGKVLGNMLKAHVSVYRQLKALPAGQSAQVRDLRLVDSGATQQLLSCYLPVAVGQTAH